MTLGNLARNTTVQGDVFMTLWKDNEVACEDIVSRTEDLWREPCVQKFWRKKNIKYIFATSDALHIEFEEE